ncbi:MAG: hypothetical protein IJP33_01740 [Firmicutes bacterium]|nr:hypothetical protein [Bacillota bacterium]
MLAEQRQQYTSAEYEELRSKERKKALKLISRNKQQRIMKITLMCLVCFIFAVSFFYVAIVTESYNIAYDINAIRSDIQAMEKQKDIMSLEVAALASMERIEPLAMSMGMVYPEISDKVFVAYAPAAVAENASVMAAAPDVEIELLDSVQAADEISFGSKVLRVLGSLFGGHFNIGAE